ncbi:MAG: AAA family ATPase [Actinobacteria bacterium]|nr:AAA family ATPase [Actinomycetota bacterium]
MDGTEDLRILIASRYTLVIAETRDERRFLDILRTAAGALGLPVWTWSVTKGLCGAGGEAVYQTTDVQRAFQFIDELKSPGIFVFADAHNVLQDPLVVRRIKEFAQAQAPGQTVILTAPDPVLPPELAGLALPWKLQPPGREELQRLVDRSLANFLARGVPVDLDEAAAGSLVEALRGLSLSEAEGLLEQSAARDGRVDAADIRFVRASKAERMGGGGVLELVEADLGTLDDVGGLDALKSWLRLREKALEPGAEAFGLEPPRGILITGVPGCGKSLIAKTLARTWDQPLVLLDPGRIYAKYVGESERRLGEALDAVDAMAPVVLWIDELEKGFAPSGDGDGGVSQRVLGTFLRWMQERPDGVFIAATCNDVRRLPPELLRKGRFDEIFFVDLPGEDERREILRLHLASRDRDPKAFDIDRLVAASKGFTGAEIEAGIVGALYRAFAGGRELDTEEIERELAGTVPLSRGRAEDVAALRAWARDRAVWASGDPSQRPA